MFNFLKNLIAHHQLDQKLKNPVSNDKLFLLFQGDYFLFDHRWNHICRMERPVLINDFNKKDLLLCTSTNEKSSYYDDRNIYHQKNTWVRELVQPFINDGITYVSPEIITRKRMSLSTYLNYKEVSKEISRLEKKLRESKEECAVLKVENTTMYTYTIDLIIELENKIKKYEELGTQLDAQIYVFLKKERDQDCLLSSKYAKTIGQLQATILDNSKLNDMADAVEQNKALIAVYNLDEFSN